MVHDNYIKEGNNVYGGLYFDYGAAFITARNNVIDFNYQVLLWLLVSGDEHTHLVVDRTYTNMGNGFWDTKATVTNTTVVQGQAWPAAATAIIAAAGLEPAYADLLSRKPATLTVTVPAGNICKAHR